MTFKLNKIYYLFPNGIRANILLFAFLTVPAIPKISLGNDVWLTPAFALLYIVFFFSLVFMMLQTKTGIIIPMELRNFYLIVIISFFIYIIKWFFSSIIIGIEPPGFLLRHFLYYHSFLVILVCINIFKVVTPLQWRTWILLLLWITLISTLFYYSEFLGIIFYGGEVLTWKQNAILAGNFNKGFDLNTLSIIFIPRGARTIFAILILICSEIAFLFIHNNILRWLVVSFCYFLIFLTGSRTAYLFMIYVLFIHFTLIARMNRLRRFAILLIFLVVINYVGFYVIKNQHYLFKIVEILGFFQGKTSHGSSIFQRLDCWAAIINALIQNPWALIWGLPGRFIASPESIVLYQIHLSGFIGLSFFVLLWIYHIKILNNLLHQLPRNTKEWQFYRFIKWFTFFWIFTNLIQGQDYINFQLCFIYWGIIGLGFTMTRYYKNNRLTMDSKLLLKQ